jgi:hypothetical protein
MRQPEQARRGEQGVPIGHLAIEEGKTAQYGENWVIEVSDACDSPGVVGHLVAPATAGKVQMWLQVRAIPI